MITLLHLIFPLLAIQCLEALIIVKFQATELASFAYAIISCRCFAGPRQYVTHLKQMHS